MADPEIKAFATAAPGHVTVVRVPRDSSIERSLITEAMEKVGREFGERLEAAFQTLAPLSKPRPTPDELLVPPDGWRRARRIWGKRVIHGKDGIVAASEPMWLDSATGEPLERADDGGPIDLPDCRVVRPPFLTARLFRFIERAKREGLRFPPPARWVFAWVDAPASRTADGLTRLEPSGYIRVWVNINAPADQFERNIWHELKHAADFFEFGARFSNEESERRAAGFATSMMAPLPAPAPRVLSAAEKLKLEIAAEERKAQEAKELSELEWRLKALREPETGYALSGWRR